jgi:hypothetical protein
VNQKKKLEVETHERQVEKPEFEMFEEIDEESDLKDVHLENDNYLEDESGYNEVLKSESMSDVTNSCKPYKCQKCNNTFISFDSLSRHDVTYHRNERTHLCKFCGQVFERKDGLICHEAVHNVLDALYSNPDKQKEQGDHSLIDERCKLCNKVLTFVSESGSVKHLAKHSCRSIKCKKCTSAFISLDSLRRHDVKCHAHERTHSCKFCGKVFERKDGLICHEAVHKAEDCSFYSNPSQHTIVKDSVIRKRQYSDTGDPIPKGFTVHGNRRLNSGEHKQMHTVYTEVVAGQEKQKNEASTSSDYHIVRRTCTAVLDSGEICKGRYMISPLQNFEKRCQKCGVQPKPNH